MGAASISMWVEAMDSNHTRRWERPSRDPMHPRRRHDIHEQWCCQAPMSAIAVE